jgi:hypothetical protein
MSGIEMLPKPRAARPEVPVITAYGDHNTTKKGDRSAALKGS